MTDLPISLVKLNHASAYAFDPKRAAQNLSLLVDGTIAPFPPCPGGWVCFMSGRSWSGPFIEFYPRNMSLTHKEGHTDFIKLEHSAEGAGTHFNLSVSKTRQELEKICRDRGIVHSWRSGQELLDVWLDEGLLVEPVPAEGK